MLYIKHCDPFKSKASNIISLFKTISFFPRQLRIKSNFCTILNKLCIAWVTSMHLTSAAAGHSSLPLSFLLFGDHTKHIFLVLLFLVIISFRFSPQRLCLQDEFPMIYEFQDFLLCPYLFWWQLWFFHTFTLHFNLCLILRSMETMTFCLCHTKSSLCNKVHT